MHSRFLLALVALCAYLARAQGQECTATTCVDISKLVQFQVAYATDPRFSGVNEACGGSIISKVAGLSVACTRDVTVPNTCPCMSGDTCKAAVANISEACATSVNSLLCAEAPAMEAKFGQNVRGLLHHIMNDCGNFTLDCPDLPPFDTSVCGGPPAPGAASTNTSAPSPSSSTSPSPSPAPGTGSSSAARSVAMAAAIAATVIAAFM